MKIEYYHASEYGNGARVAEEFRRIMGTKGIVVNVRHVKDAEPREIPPADLYLFSSPGRMGRPIRGMRHFLKKTQLPSGSRYALLVTEMNPGANKDNGNAPAEAGLGKCQQVIPTMNQMLQGKGMTNVLEGKIFVTGLKGPLEERWQSKVEDYVKTLLGTT